MPHPDSLSGIGTSRTTTPGSSDIQVMACGVPGLPRLAMRLLSKIRYMSVAPSGCDGSSGTASTTHSGLRCSFMLAFPLCATGTKNGGSNVAHRCPAEEYLHHRLLRARRERPRGRRAEQRDERAPSHSITSSAVASSVAGTSMPIVLAVCRLITSSYLVGAWTGRSPGFSPLSTRPT